MGTGFIFLFLLLGINPAFSTEVWQGNEWTPHPGRSGIFYRHEPSEDALRINDPKINFRPRPNACMRELIRDQNKILYDNVYCTDNEGRRPTPGLTAQLASRDYIALFGCSMVFGSGIAEKETLAAYMEDKVKNRAIHNYGIMGSGPGVTLEFLRGSDLNRLIPQAKGIGFYFFYSFHLERLLPFFPSVLWTGDMPTFRANAKGDWERIGTIKEYSPRLTSIYLLVGGFLKKIGIRMRLPFWTSRHAVDYTCATLEAMSKEFRIRKNGDRFVIVFPEVNTVTKRVEQCLNTKGVQTFSWNRKKREGDYLEFDGHPSARFNQDLALELVKNYF